MNTIPTRLVRAVLAAAVASLVAVAALPAVAVADTTAPHGFLDDYAPRVDGSVDDTLAGSWVFHTDTPYWAAVGEKVIAPALHGDVFTGPVADNGDGTFTDLYQSTYSGEHASIIEFDVIDSNPGRAPFGAYGTIASFFDRSPTSTTVPLSYTVMLAQGSSMLPAGVSQIDTSGSKFIAVRDVYAQQGQTITITIANTASGLRSFSRPIGIQALLFASDPADAGSWVQPRGSAVARTVLNGAKTLTYTAPRSAYYGAVFVNSTGGRSIFVNAAVS